MAEALPMYGQTTTVSSIFPLESFLLLQILIIYAMSPLTFRNRLPDSRLGQKHDRLATFVEAVLPWRPPLSEWKSKEFTLVVVTADENDSIDTPSQRILLGMKNRGFGKGMYNSFGGKFQDGETVEECACRELQEETNICVSLKEMTNSKVGIQRYTFDKDPVEMIMHVFRIHLNAKQTQVVVGCDEISPEWFYDITAIPLDNMFADDSLWLTALLSSDEPVCINGSYHFRENCQETNTILHYHMDITPKPCTKYTLEQRLFHALHDSNIHSPSIKEFKENYAFCNTVRNSFSTRQRKRFHHTLDVVIDVAGGHGALGALFLICTSAFKAVIVDPADVGRGGVMRAWGEDFIGKNKELSYRHECLRKGLPEELDKALAMTTKSRILVVACHACQHLTEEILSISCQYGVHVAVMPCCQKDISSGSSWKSTSKNLSVPMAEVMDLLQCGKIIALGSHDVRMKVIDRKITPQNRIICCRALAQQEVSTSTSLHQERINAAHSQLEQVYQKAHQVSSRRHQSSLGRAWDRLLSSPPGWFAVGFAAGIVCVATFRQK